jgi:integrase
LAAGHPFHEQAKLLSLDGEWANLWKVLLCTGMRIGEACGLKWDDLDLEARTLSVRQALQAVRGGYRIVTPKTRSSRRTLKLSPELVEVFEHVRASQRADAAHAGDAWAETGFVFTKPDGQPIPTYTPGNVLTRSLKALGLPHARVHDMRHTYASSQLLAGTPMLEVSRALGHASVALTFQVYTHPRLLIAATPSIY